MGTFGFQNMYDIIYINLMFIFKLVCNINERELDFLVLNVYDFISLSSMMSFKTVYNIYKHELNIGFQRFYKFWFMR